MAIIAPTVMTDNQELFAQLMADYQGFAKRIQIDASDGSFAPNALVSLQNVTFPEGVTVDVHLMSARPSEHLERILALKPALCILHAEANDDLPAIFQKLRAAGIRVGVALLKETLPSRVENLIQDADHVMIFAGNLGQQGGTIDMLQTEKIPLVRKIKSDVEIGWDGGANLSNVRALAHAGVDVIYVGSAISQAADRPAMYQSLIAETEKKGVLI